MKKQDQLFYLVKSLTKSEKRYFRRFAALNGDQEKSYLKVFDFIEQQTCPHDGDLREYFKEEAFTDQLHVVKNYLTSVLLKCLRNFGDHRTKARELRNLLSEIEILLEKELYESARGLIRKVIALAEKYEKFEVLMEAYRLKRLLLQNTRGFIAREEIVEVLREERRVLEKMGHLNEYQHLSYRLMVDGFGKMEESIMKDPLMESDARADSLQSQIHFHHTRYAAHAVGGRNSESFRSLSLLIEMLESQPHRIVEDPRSYITILNNQIGALLHSKRLDEVPALLSKIREVPTRYKMPANAFQVKTFLSTYNVELELYRDTRQWEKGLALIAVIEDFIRENAAYINEERKITFYYQFAYIFFKTGKFSQSLRYINEITSGQFGTIRIDIITYSLFMNLIIHFELRNIIVLRYAVTSCRRYFQKRRQLLHYEKRLLRFFSKASTSPESEWPGLFGKLQEELFTRVTASEKEEILDYLDFDSWIADNISLNKKAISA